MVTVVVVVTQVMVTLLVLSLDYRFCCSANFLNMYNLYYLHMLDIMYFYISGNSSRHKDDRKTQFKS